MNTKGIAPVHEYASTFYRYTALSAARSAAQIVPKIAGAISVHSVVDFGCGEGAWLAAWQEAGASVTGVDGPYVQRSRLEINPVNFHAANLAEAIDLGRAFDVVQSLEVAEHLPRDCATAFVDTLVAHGSIILFSAAIPGQGGENHVNEQPLDYWRQLFRERGYVAVDYIRPLLVNDTAIAPWYRYNLILYVRKDALKSVSKEVRRCLVADDRPLANYWPYRYRLRHLLLRLLPVSVVDYLARANAARSARDRSCAF